jgi:hypothetical protein
MGVVALLLVTNPWQVLTFRPLMNKDALDEILSRYSGTPKGPVPTAEDWMSIEMLIGRPIPADFKAILQRTGGEAIGRCWMRNPAEKDNIYIALSHAALMRLQVLEGEVALEEFRIALYPEIGGWVQLASIDRNWLMLKPEGDDIAIVDFSGWEIHESGMTFAELMWAMFSDRTLYDELGASNWHESRQFFGRE